MDQLNKFEIVGLSPIEIVKNGLNQNLVIKKKFVEEKFQTSQETFQSKKTVAEKRKNVNSFLNQSFLRPLAPVQENNRKGVRANQLVNQYHPDIQV